MGTLTTFLSLFKPATSDLVDVAADLDNNFDKIDATATLVTPANVSTAAATGSNLTFARTDHVHACGTISPAAITGSPAATLGATSTTTLSTSGALTPASIAGSPASTLGATTTTTLSASGHISMTGSSPTLTNVNANFIGATIAGRDNACIVTLPSIGSPASISAGTTLCRVNLATAVASGNLVFSIMQYGGGIFGIPEVRPLIQALTFGPPTTYDIYSPIAFTPPVGSSITFHVTLWFA